jgi:succinylglutamic semialdehyde dehydrogenase
VAALITSVSPWDEREQVFSTSASDATAIGGAVARLAASARAWAEDAPARVAGLERLAGVLARRRQETVALLVREAGKVESDAVQEADLLVRKIAISLTAGLARTPPPSAAAGSPGEPWQRWRARGLAAVLGPFNFPLHLLHGLVVPALAVGATVLAKPSERCPALGELYRSCLLEAGLGEVCAVVQGGAAVAQELTRLPSLACLAAVGGRATGVALSRALAERPEVVLALELGGVNQALVLLDADAAAAAGALAEGAWRMAGQRCTATRVVHVPEAWRGDLLALLAVEQERWRPDGSVQGASGPLIDLAAATRMHAAYADLPAGLRLRAGSLGRRFAHGACVEPLLLELTAAPARAHPLYAEEQFCPALIVDGYRDLEECLERMAANPYRLAASVFTASQERFLACAQRLPYGQVNHNRQTAGARSDQPFGGLGRSGNGHPAGIAAGAIFSAETVVWPGA